jgi:hypothetical protein
LFQKKPPAFLTILKTTAQQDIAETSNTIMMSVEPKGLGFVVDRNAGTSFINPYVATAPKMEHQQATNTSPPSAFCLVTG